MCRHVSFGQIYTLTVGAYVLVNYVVMFLMRASTRRDDKKTIMMQRKNNNNKMVCRAWRKWTSKRASKTVRERMKNTNVANDYMYEKRKRERECKWCRVTGQAYNDFRRRRRRRRRWRWERNALTCDKLTVISFSHFARFPLTHSMFTSSRHTLIRRSWACEPSFA